MLFIWSSEGGPLQYIGLGIFLLQVLPQVLPELNLNNFINQETSLTIGLFVGVLSVAAWQLRTVDFTALRQHLNQRLERARLQLEEVTGRPVAYYAVPALMGVCAGAIVSLGSTVELMRWLPYVGQLATLLSFFGMGRANNRQRQEQQRTSQAKLEAMTTLVRRMPLDPFVTEEEMKKAPILELKKMMERRGSQPDELDSFVDRQNLVEALQKRRQYSDTCCICFEDYNKGEQLRILPNCCHELHVECLDKWVYTFATNAAKLRQVPTCPLCKEGLCSEAEMTKAMR